ncbi:MAG: ATP-binding cassette domain-containing protein [Eubacteriales bacterium]|nr:ATP-binding cassette domain-containing protein [Eubacteriales bacterium]
MELLAIKDLSFRYAGSDSAAISGVSFSVERGDFLAVCGATGSGKSTLLRLIKRELAPRGKAEGEILFCGKPLCELDDRKAAQKIGYVAQRPEEQIVTDRVWHELAFGLENLGLPTGVIRRRVAETACFFGIEEWFDKSTDELSGGQKQLLSLASVMVMQPELLLLDEPTARLDPIASGDFINAVERLNRELSLTVIMISHCLEDVLPVANRVLALEGGRVAEYGETRKAVGKIKNIPSLAGALPAAARLYSRLGADCECPLTVREGRDLIEHNFKSSVRALPLEEYVHNKNVALEFSGVYFRYSREQEDVLRGLELKVYENEIFCLLGGNGSGKSTALAAAAGLIKPYAGNIRVFGKKVTDREFARAGLLTLLPQDVQTVFLKSTVRAELADANVTEGALTQELDRLMDRHPYDLSGGQQQLLALAKALAARPRLLLLDEPTRGLDAGAKAEFVSVLRKLRDGGMTVVLVTHDAELAADVSDRCALFFRGEIIADDVPRRFFSGNSFYTTAANRICRGYYDLVATVDDAARICLANGKKEGGE